jgi:hypothetical protein
MVPSLGTTPNGENINLNVDRLIETRMLLTASSGGGKSQTIRRILEQTHGHVQQIVIDPEDEFYTLREKFDYILAGRTGGDCPADLRSAGLLAHKLLELGASAIIGIYELKYHDRIQFVKLFLDSMLSAPKSLWHPVLVVVDEAHLFCPQAGEAASAGSVIDLMSRGRKRGFAGILASQRLSKLHKDAAAEAKNYLIGQCSLDVDVKRASDYLGFNTKQHAYLRGLRPGQFFVYGPALSTDVVLCQVGAITTSHPKAGQQSVAPVAPPATIKRVLSQLVDLPAEAEKVLKTEADLKAEVRRLNHELKQAKAQQAGPSEEDLARIAKKARDEAEQLFVKELSSYLERLSNLNNAYQHSLTNAIKDIKADARKPIQCPATFVSKTKNEPDKFIPLVLPMAAKAAPAKRSAEYSIKLSDIARKILTALAQYPQGRTQQQIATLTGYRVSGHFMNTLGSLRTNQLISEARVNPITITATGLEVLGPYDELPTGQELQAYWLHKLPSSESKILEVLLSIYPDGLDQKDLAAKAGFAVSGHFMNMMGHLRALELISPARTLPRAAEIFFEDV